MSKLEKRWHLRTADETKVAALHESLKVHPALCRILALLGVRAETAADVLLPLTYEPEMAPLRRLA